MSCPQIWNIEQEKDREKERVGGRPVKLKEKKGDKGLEREIKNKGDEFGREKNMEIQSGGEKMRNASAQQGAASKVKMSDSEHEHRKQNIG